MLPPLNKNHKVSYGFLFKPFKGEQVASLCATGQENRGQESNYYWDCNEHPHHDSYVFQYTLRGRGSLTIKDTTYQILPGHAFMIPLPLDASYYLPKDSEHWEFVYITIRGAEAKKCWQYVNEIHGYVFPIPETSHLIQNLISTYQLTKNNKINTSYVASSKAYEFITHCYQYFQQTKNNSSARVSIGIHNALKFMKTNFHLNLSVDEIAEEAKFSKYYFIKKFKEEMKIPPLQYLNRYRIYQSLLLLQTTDLQIKDIAVKVGFFESNYFNKVFRKIMGISPGKYRKANPLTQAVDYVLTDAFDLDSIDEVVLDD